MPDLMISASAVKSLCERHGASATLLTELNKLIELYGQLSTMPPVTFRSDIQQHSHWIQHTRYVQNPHPYIDDYFQRWIQCPVCGFIDYLPGKTLDWNSIMTPACSRCGCLMDDGQVQIIKHERAVAK